MQNSMARTIAFAETLRKKLHAHTRVELQDKRTTEHSFVVSFDALNNSMGAACAAAGGTRGFVK